ncbi:NADPH-dependent 1-acyl dihydroxyacetone phosphate reductase [Kalmusia sp. IMI 367209]|nr:NADPH-dependent 1-acyl dihydroxyacetone phosphate reductase [Kalmusia sp. IMI 367209]
MVARNPAVLITGCGNGGIGHALAKEFKAKGYTVITTLLAHEDNTHLVEAGIHSFVADVTKDADLEGLRKQVSELTDGHLDVLVNNAGICYTMTAVDHDVAQAEKMFAVNVFGPMRMVVHFHKLLVAAKGKVVNIGSVGGIVPYVYGASYNASKAALHHWGNTLRVELKPLGVDVVNIISGEVATNILKSDRGRTLPAGSLYAPLAAEFAGHVDRTPNTTTPQQYAAAVVGEVSKRHSQAWFWTGATTSIVRWGDMFLPRTYWDGLFTKWFNLNKLKVERA